jgi:hypothetical protein
MRQQLAQRPRILPIYLVAGDEISGALFFQAAVIAGEPARVIDPIGADDYGAENAWQRLEPNVYVRRLDRTAQLHLPDAGLVSDPPRTDGYKTEGRNKAEVALFIGPGASLTRGKRYLCSRYRGAGRVGYDSAHCA